MIKATLALTLALGFVTACHHDKPVTKPMAPDTTPPPTATTTPPTTTNQPVSQNLGVSSDLADKCKIQHDPASQPKFDFDNANLTPEDRSVLDQLATCLTTGPLKGQGITLTGRADPRGTEEYNLGLGSSRAHSVSSYLQKLGVQQQQLGVTTRGSLDATGTDENGWREDRRVDIALKS